MTIGSGFSLRALHDRRVRVHQARIDDRLAAGEDRYFEELRELKTYDPRHNPPWKNITRELLMLAAEFATLVILLTSLEF
ncbi:hypothetical protein [Erythrobacter sp. THAF29]|uniref:hypothetical protein n=1 Tax=Erythrobacter sp. THAF29 TaxID=2587851 RepID=UPI001268D08C|nr:hypothetical protein [Erythrobacter sp. THAF29]